MLISIMGAHMLENGRLIMAKVFVVEDNAVLSEAIVSYLVVEGHTVVLFERIAGVYDAARIGRPDLVVLDVMLPDGDGFLLGRKLKQELGIPLLFLTARSSESDRITGFELGADDYVVKPFSMRELMLRVKAVVARTRLQAVPTQTTSVPTWKLENPDSKDAANQSHVLTLDGQTHTATHDGVEVGFTATEWKILAYLAEREDRVINREQLLGMCLDYLAEGSERTINTHMKNIRAKLGQVEWIKTIRGFGYRFLGKAVSQ